MKIHIYDNDLGFLGQRFKEARKAAGLRHIEVVREAGYKNINKGCRRIIEIERAERKQTGAVYERFAHVLAMDLEELTEALLHERHLVDKEWRENLPPAILGDVLRAARRRAGMDIDEVVHRCGLEGLRTTRSRIARLESGEARFPSWGERYRLADTLSIKQDVLDRAYEEECALYDGQGTLYALFRAVPTVPAIKRISGGLRTKEAISYARKLASEVGREVIVVFPDFRHLYISSGGSRREKLQPPSRRRRVR